MNRQFEWKTNNYTRFTWNMYHKFIRISVWLFGLNNSITRLSIMRLSSRIQTLVKCSGMTFTCQYLKECLRLCQKHIACEQTQSSEEPRVATRRGLPLIIPGDLRLSIERRDPVIIKLVLTVLSVYRVMPAAPKLKLETITSPFKGLYKTTPEIIPVVSQIKYHFFSKTIEEYFIADKSPFEKARKLLTLTTAGPNQGNQLLGYPIDALALSRNPTLLKAFTVFCINTNCQDLLRKLHKEIQVFYTNSNVRNILEEWILSGEDRLKVGKLALKQEPAGKVRVFAIVDAWTQSLLAPLHKNLFSILEQIPSDGTFNQLAPIKRLMEKGFKQLYSFDLSAATDRLPIDIQVELLSHLFNNRSTAEAWRDLLIGRDYHLNNSQFSDHNGIYRYEVGQPMGALSSWAMLALTHHTIVQVAARRVGFKDWFGDYALLGDDIVIANTSVAESYLTIMTDLGVDINLSKSLVSSQGIAEFAKKLIGPDYDFSPLGPKSIFEFIKSPLYFKDIYINYGLYHNIEEPLLDGEVLVDKLQNLLRSAVSFSSHKWLRKLQSSYWDIVSYFGLNLVQDLSPSITASAINSLDTRNRKIYDDLFEEHLNNKITRGWFKALESDEKTYRRYRRFLSIDSFTRFFPSTQDLLTNYSELLQSSASHYLYDFDSLTIQDKTRLAYSQLSKITWSFEKPKVKRNIRSMELSSDLLKRLAQDSPSLLIKVLSNSQAVSSFNKLEVDPAMDRGTNPE